MRPRFGDDGVGGVVDRGELVGEREIDDLTFDAEALIGLFALWVRRPRVERHRTAALTWFTVFPAYSGVRAQSSKLELRGALKNGAGVWD